MGGGWGPRIGWPREGEEKTEKTNWRKKRVEYQGSPAGTEGGRKRQSLEKGKRKPPNGVKRMKKKKKKREAIEKKLSGKKSHRKGGTPFVHTSEKEVLAHR